MFGIQDFVGFAEAGVTTANFNSAVEPGKRQPIIRVYTKAKWADSWTLDSTLVCTWAEWELSPKMPTAELSRRYGWKLVDGSWVRVEPLLNDYRVYVKIRFSPWDTGEDELVWYGITGAITQIDGGTATRNATDVPTGRQVIACTGLEKLLADTTVVSSAYYDELQYNVKYVRKGLTFNAPLETNQQSGNRTAVKYGGSYVFSNEINGSEAFWNTQQIVEYLLEYNQPMAYNFAERIPFTISDESLALLGAGIFRPIVETDGRHVKDILDQLIYRKRLLSYYLTIDELNNAVELVVVSLSHVSLVSGGELMALPNPNKYIVRFEECPGESAVYWSQHEPVDRVRYRGAKARVVCTLGYGDGTLVDGWTSAQETEYEAGASTLDGYGTTVTSFERLRAWNAYVRSQYHLREVFSFFKLPDDWELEAGNGTTGSLDSILTNNNLVGTPPWAQSGCDDDRPHSNTFNREVYIVSQSPMLYGMDYSVAPGPGFMITPTELAAVQHRPMGTQVYLWSDKESRYYPIDKIGLAGDTAPHYGAESFEWSASVRVEERSRGFFIDVMGKPQHMIARNHFTGLTSPKSGSTYVYDKVKKAWDYADMIATVTIELPFRCEGAYPQTNQFANRDYIREVVISAGEQYRLDWLHPYTVVAIDNAGGISQNNTGGYINNDQIKLQERAKVAYYWYRTPRAAIQFSTRKISNKLPLGSMVYKYGNTYYKGAKSRYTNSVVSTIRIDAPLGTADSPGDGIKQTYTTDYVLDIDLL